MLVLTGIGGDTLACMGGDILLSSILACLSFRHLLMHANIKMMIHKNSSNETATVTLTKWINKQVKLIK